MKRYKAFEALKGCVTECLLKGCVILTKTRCAVLEYLDTILSDSEMTKTGCRQLKRKLRELHVSCGPTFKEINEQYTCRYDILYEDDIIPPQVQAVIKLQEDIRQGNDHDANPEDTVTHFLKHGDTLSKTVRSNSRIRSRSRSRSRNRRRNKSRSKNTERVETVENNNSVR